MLQGPNFEKSYSEAAVGRYRVIRPSGFSSVFAAMVGFCSGLRTREANLIYATTRVLATSSLALSRAFFSASPRLEPWPRCKRGSRLHIINGAVILISDFVTDYVDFPAADLLLSSGVPLDVHLASFDETLRLFYRSLDEIAPLG
jgi:hypothetical protein